MRPAGRQFDMSDVDCKTSKYTTFMPRTCSSFRILIPTKQFSPYIIHPWTTTTCQQRSLYLGTIVHKFDCINSFSPMLQHLLATLYFMMPFFPSNLTFIGPYLTAASLAGFHAPPPPQHVQQTFVLRAKKNWKVRMVLRISVCFRVLPRTFMDFPSLFQLLEHFLSI